MCRANISCACLGMNFGWGAEGLSLVCWTCSLSALADGLCPCVSHEVFPLAALNAFKALLSFSGQGSIQMFFSCPSIAKGQFLSKAERLNFLGLRNQADVSGNHKCLAATKNLGLCLHCWLWAGSLLRAAVLALLGVQAGHSQRWTEFPLTIERGGEVWPYTALQTWASPAATI